MNKIEADAFLEEMSDKKQKALDRINSFRGKKFSDNGTSCKCPQKISEDLSRRVEENGTTS